VNSIPEFEFIVLHHFSPLEKPQTLLTAYRINIKNSSHENKEGRSVKLAAPVWYQD